MFDNFTAFDIEVEPSVTIHGTRSGNGPPLLLLHGFPQTHHIWHLVTPQLTSTYTVICIDLRGYGASSKPAGSESHIEYAKSTMSRDCATVMSKLGFEGFYLCGHDRGARVAHKLCIDHPEKVKAVILLDICPTLAMFEQTNQAFATAYWHWFFLIQKSPFPESVIVSNPQFFARAAFSLAKGGPQSIDQGAMQEYVKACGDMETVKGMCEDYRAAASVDLEEQKEDINEGRKIQCPVTVLWAANGTVGKMFDAVKEWKKVSDGDVNGEGLDCGHYIPEEMPDVVVKYIKELFV
jgi:haloacetate dehalogenase